MGSRAGWRRGGVGLGGFLLSFLLGSRSLGEGHEPTPAVGAFLSGSPGCLGVTYVVAPVC